MKPPIPKKSKKGRKADSKMREVAMEYTSMHKRIHK